MDQLLVIDVAERLSSRVQGTVLGEGHHVVSWLAQLLATCERCLDLAITYQLSRQRAKERLALVCRLIEFPEPFAVALQGRGEGRGGGA